MIFRAQRQGREDDTHTHTHTDTDTDTGAPSRAVMADRVVVLIFAIAAGAAHKNALKRKPGQTLVDRRSAVAPSAN